MLSSSFSTLLLHPLSTLFPYTTLFRSNVIGNPILPLIKLCANPRTVRLMPEHIDVDVSGITRREINMDQAGDKLLEMMLRTANGRLTAAEALGHREFVLTRLYESA